MVPLSPSLCIGIKGAVISLEHIVLVFICCGFTCQIQEKAVGLHFGMYMHVHAMYMHVCAIETTQW